MSTTTPKPLTKIKRITREEFTKLCGEGKIKTVAAIPPRAIVNVIKKPPTISSNSERSEPPQIANSATVQINKTIIPLRNYNDLMAEIKQLKERVAALEREKEGENIVNVYIEMDIQSPIQTLTVLLQEKTGKDLGGYSVWLKNEEMLDPLETLLNQCEDGEGVVQVNAQISDGVKRINITDVVIPSGEVNNAMEIVEENNYEDDVGGIDSTMSTLKKSGQILLWQVLNIK